MKTKIYKVNFTDGSAAPRLVRAQNKAQAIRHAVRDSYRADLATQDDLVSLVRGGIAIEEAKADPAEPADML